MPSKVWVEITYSSLNSNGAVDAWEWLSNFTQHFVMDVITYPCRDKIHVSKMGPCTAGPYLLFYY